MTGDTPPTEDVAALKTAAERVADLEAVSQFLALEAALAKRELEAMRRTVSWRITAPLRAVRRFTRRWRRS
ncbi:hypothetical protein sos41_27030 [Alphaproteobacteria bacterium SO-S41]|nr:hypothetical protein sos41_27030 [Alphaproteobacteria bacterium SO-S41]